MKKLNLLLATFLLINFSVHSQYSVLKALANEYYGAHPYNTLSISGDSLYGMTLEGGDNGYGTIFKVNINGSGYTKIFDFDSINNGSFPHGSLIISGNILFGATTHGGAASDDFGTIFKINKSGTGYTKLFDFSGANGEYPISLVLSGSTLYGMANSGGTNGYGVIYKINTDGSGFAKILDFDSINNGSYPCGDLFLSGTILYGMTAGGGDNDLGTIFKINTNGSGFSKILDFDDANGGNPFGTPIVSNNILFGMTMYGGVNDEGVIFKINNDGSSYKKLYDFNNTVSGQYPEGALVISDSILYGMNPSGGANDCGVIFKIDTGGTVFSKLHEFDCTNGGVSYGSLLMSGSDLYGMTFYGGTDDIGVIFKYAISTGVKEILQNAEMKITQSASDVFIESKELIKNINVYDINGKLCFYSEPDESSTKISLTGFSNGVYVLKVQSSNNVFQKKIEVF
ncbi:MAG: T9SS type A sorting domain-containing protein [Bacteroidales bacterium]|nr:T9SS type A sorting domain-containing protein [Bacteroidales bacterium]